MNEPAFSGLERLSPAVDTSLFAGVNTVVGIVIPDCVSESAIIAAIFLVVPWPWPCRVLLVCAHCSADFCLPSCTFFLYSADNLFHCSGV
jgi:hypothetical protein